MAKAELKTKQTEASVDEFINSIDESQRADSQKVLKMMADATGDKGKMWGSSIVGFGYEHLTYASGRELDWFTVGFSPRKANLTLYVLKGSPAKYDDLLEQLGKHTVGKGCLYIKKLSDVNENVLKKIINRSVDEKHQTKLMS